MRTLVLTLALAATGCSLIFDPSRVPSSGCPASAERCSAPPNARATCDDTRCSYTCMEGSRDADGRADTGCEATCAAPASPTTLVVTSLPAAPDALEWTFPIVTDAVGYRLCTGVAAGTPTCVTVPAGDCAGGTCTTRTTGHPLKAQISGQVQAVNACQTASPEAMAARATGFTMRTIDAAPWTSDSACMPMASVAGDVLAVEQPAFCLGSAVFGDEQWRSGTFEVELRPSGQLGLNAGGGLVFSSGNRRLGVLIGPASLPIGEGALAVRESRNNGGWQWLATSGASLVPDEWSRLRVVLQDPFWSVSVARPNEPLREVIRYHDGASTAGAWRVGLHAITPNLLASGRIEFRNLTLSSASALPAVGPSSQTWTVAPTGVQPPVRVTGTPGTHVRYESCPAFPAASACTAATMCTPTSATCARIAKGPFTGGSLTFDLPPGLDTRQPWSLRFRFAPAADGGFAGGVVAFSPHGNLLEPENAWDGGVRGVNGRWGLPLVADTWNLAEYRFDPVAGAWSARLNGQAATPPVAQQRFPPNQWDKHVGAIMLGAPGLGVVDFWVSDVTIAP